jgi:hypothetical protein
VAALAAGAALPATAYSERTVALAFGIFALAFVLVGALLAVRRPANAVGALMLAIGVLMTVMVASGQYAGYVLLRDPSLPLGIETAWLGSWIYIPALGLMVVLLLVFPLGRVERAWRWPLRACLAGTGVATVAQALLPGPMDGFGELANPFGIEAAESPLQLAVATGGAVVGLTLIVAVIGVFVRLRRARGDERQQLKWFAYAAGLLVVCQLPNVLPLGLDSSLLGLVLVVVALTAVPVAVAVAVLKYRLYDIDVVINRTLVYAGLTATLGGTYLALVLLVSLAVGESGLATAVSTLGVAALFRPARARIQGVVDRRFYRRRYDATLTLEAFGARLRDELDLDSLGADLRGVVSDTVQPTHVSLWLRSEA